MTRPALDHFEQSLLTELRREVAERSPAPARSRHQRRRRLAGLATTGVAAVSIATGALLLRPDAAFAVTERPDGDIVVTISSLKDAEGLERALAEHGVKAEVSYDAEGIDGPPVPDLPADGQGAVSHAESAAEDEAAAGGLDARAEDGTPIPPPDLDRLPCGAIAVEVSDKGVTFRLPASAVAAKSPLVIRTAGGGEDGWSSIGVQWTDPVC